MAPARLSLVGAAVDHPARDLAVSPHPARGCRIGRRIPTVRLPDHRTQLDGGPRAPSTSSVAVQETVTGQYRRPRWGAHPAVTVASVRNDSRGCGSCRGDGHPDRLAGTLVAALPRRLSQRQLWNRPPATLHPSHRLIQSPAHHLPSPLGAGTRTVRHHHRVESRGVSSRRRCWIPADHPCRHLCNDDGPATAVVIGETGGDGGLATGLLPQATTLPSALTARLCEPPAAIDIGESRGYLGAHARAPGNHRAVGPQRQDCDSSRRDGGHAGEVDRHIRLPV